MSQENYRDYIMRNAVGSSPAPSAGPAVSAFQKKIRGEETELREHICKEMNALNLERCRCIPKEQPGADWRVLQTIVEEDPSREKYQVFPLTIYLQSKLI